MRELLAPLEGQRLTFTGTFAGYGCRPHYGNVYLQTVLLQDVTTADGAPATDHVWMYCGERFGALDLRRGDKLTFQARVRPYHKGQIYCRKNGRLKRVKSYLDFTLSYPTRIVHESAQGVPA
jgi:hypothetical protein